jgi:hypothetical protein
MELRASRQSSMIDTAGHFGIGICSDALRHFLGQNEPLETVTAESMEEQ